jgi:hypothetical protein
MKREHALQVIRNCQENPVCLHRGWIGKII